MAQQFTSQVKEVILSSLFKLYLASKYFIAETMRHDYEISAKNNSEIQPKPALDSRNLETNSNKIQLSLKRLQIKTNK